MISNTITAKYIGLGITFSEKYRATDMESNTITAKYTGLGITFSEKYRAIDMISNTITAKYIGFGIIFPKNTQPAVIRQKKSPPRMNNPVRQADLLLMPKTSSHHR